VHFLIRIKPETIWQKALQEKRPQKRKTAKQKNGRKK
jgi:hypothetical protein